MCYDNNTIPAQMEQAIGWVWDGLWGLIDENSPSVHVEFVMYDLIHLENMWRGKDGYNPDVVADFPIGL